MQVKARSTLIEILAVLVGLAVFTLALWFIHQYNEEDSVRMLGLPTVGFDKDHDGELDPKVFVIAISRCCGVVSFLTKATPEQREMYRGILRTEANGKGK